MECRLFWGANLTNHCSVWGKGMSKVNRVVRGWDLVRLYRCIGPGQSKVIPGMFRNNQFCGRSRAAHGEGWGGWG